MKKLLLILGFFVLHSKFLSAQTHTELKLDINKNERLLVLAPHPDDESLSSAGLIKRVFDLGGSVRTVVVTSGDAYVGAVIQKTGKKNPNPNDYIEFGEQRLQESQQAAKVLGKGFIHLDLLGFSDGSIYAALVNHWRRQNPMRSDYTGFDHVPYSAAKQRGIAQDGQDLHDELLAILRETKPTIISFPDVMENDSDHAGLGMFALLAIHDWLSESESLSFQPRLLAYLIHWRHDWPKGADYGISLNWQDQPLYLPDDLPLRGHTRQCLMLSSADIQLKAKALAEYHSQQQIMGPFLSAFVRNTECFTVLNSNSSRGIKNVIEHWQHARKKFDNHPISRIKI